MQDTMKTAMSTSIGDVLETMFFMSTEISEEETPADYFRSLKDRAFGGQIDFRGPSSGRFLILIPETALYAMTESFLALERDKIEERHLGGMIKEVLNMVAGNTFSTYNPDHVYELGIPKRVSSETVAKALTEPRGEPDFLMVDTTDGRLALALLHTT
jgi:hypothetical protein